MLLKFNWIKFISGYLGFSTPSYVILFPTARCNMSCKMCYYWKNIQNAKVNDELTLMEIDSISKSFGSIINLAIGGGEPFIRKDIEQICYLFYKNAKARFINIPTNASFPNQISEKVESILKLCPKAQLVIELSLDGIGLDHDSIRQHKGAFEKLKQTSLALNKLKSRYPLLHIKISSVFNGLNQEKVDDLFNHVKENFEFDDYDISLIHDNPEPKDIQSKNYLLLNFKKILKRVEDFTRKNTTTLFGKMLFIIRQLTNQDILRVAEGLKITSPCTAIRNLVVISENGDVFPCETLNENLGNLRSFDYDIKKILRSSRTKQVNEKYRIRKDCSCNWGCAIFNNKLYDPKVIPKILWKLISSR
ncbi:MAG: radical SAM protein [Bdellovibrionales bacterium]|nr:radical SAM protein [Bdellovibrionales bacterium]